MNIATDDARFYLTEGTAAVSIAGFCVDKTKSPAEAGDLAFTRWTLAVLLASLAALTTTLLTGLLLVLALLVLALAVALLLTGLLLGALVTLATLVLLGALIFI